MMKYSAIVIAALVGACASTSQGSDSAYRQARTEGSVTGINEDGERVRCERIRETGSRFTERVCRTELEWDLVQENARQAAEDSHGRYPRDCGPTPGGPPQC